MDTDPSSNEFPSFLLSVGGTEEARKPLQRNGYRSPIVKLYSEGVPRTRYIYRNCVITCH